MEEGGLFHRMKRIFQVEEEMDEDTVKEAAGLIRNIFRYMDKDAKDIMTHRKNIGRLIHHTESKIYLGKRKDA